MERHNKPLPDWIANAPTVPEHQIDVWDAFLTLSDSRPVGMAPGGIPLTEIESYLRMYDIRDPDIIDEWLALIRAMDREYLKVSAEQRES